MIEMKPVESSNIRSIGYDESKADLHVEFKGSGIYIYHDVPKEVYDGFMAAESKGNFLAKNIKGVYSASKKEGGKDGSAISRD